VALHKTSNLPPVGFTRRQNMHNTISGVAFAALLACAMGAQAQSAPAKAAAPAAKQPAPAATSAAPKETAGQTVRIAFMDPLSGPFANVGQNQLKSWQFIAERLSGKNPAGVKFEVV